MSGTEKPLRIEEVAQREAKRVAQTEREERAAWGKPWAVFRRNVRDYFSDHIGASINLHEVQPELYESISRRIWEVHQRGEKAAFLDICGQADGSGMGFDKTITFSLTSGTDVPRKIIAVEGDVFSERSRKKLQRKLEQVKGELVFVHFDPVGGFEEGTGRYLGNTAEEGYEYAMKQIEDLFERVYPRLAVDGFFAINWLSTFLHNPNAKKSFLEFLNKKNILYTCHGGLILIGKTGTEQMGDKAQLDQRP